MALFSVVTTVTFVGEIEADTPEEAEAKGWEWEDELHYDGVYSIELKEIEEVEDESEDE